MLPAYRSGLRSPPASVTTTAWPQSFWPVVNQGDAAILFCFIFFYLVFAGPGSWSLDALFSSRRNTGAVASA